MQVSFRYSCFTDGKNVVIDNAAWKWLNGNMEVNVMHSHSVRQAAQQGRSAPGPVRCHRPAQQSIENHAYEM